MSSWNGKELLTSSCCRVFLAEANLLAIRKLLSKFKSLSRDTTTPGPPLAKSHPSPSLCAKLYLNVTSLIGEAKVLSKSDFIQPFRKYLDDLEKFTEAMGYKWLGIDIGENGSIEKFGSSIAFLKLAAKALEKLRTNKKSGSQARIEEEIDSVGAFKSGYEKLNSTVSGHSAQLSNDADIYDSSFTSKRFLRLVRLLLLFQREEQPYL